MEGPRSPTLVEYPKVLEFLKENLRPEQTWSIDREYPTALSPKNLHNMQIITGESKEVLSHAVLRPTIIKTPLAAFQLAAIGSVITSEKARNQGLSKNIIRKCEELALKQGCEIAILWSNLHEFYQKLNYEMLASI
jgi:predicted N-acetyltransferase YhbS